MQKPSLPKGTRDFSPSISAKRDFIVEKITTAFKKYGFQKIETPTMENLSVLTGKYGEEGDQLLFKVLNSGDFIKKASNHDFENGSKALLPKISEKGLRYDLTVPFARYVVMNQNDIAFPFKRYQIQPVWRADRPQKGRYREFYQCDADVIGTQSQWSEVELTLLVDDVFQSLDLNNFVLKVNHREVLFGLAHWLGLQGKEIPFCTIIDKLDKVEKEIVIADIKELNPDLAKVETLKHLLNQEVNSNEESMTLLREHLQNNAGLDFVIQYFETLEQFQDRNFKVQFDWTLARGLSYYTGLIYEAKATTVKMGSILGGGRYDNLTGMFGLPDVSGVGISFGIDRIFDVMSELSLFPSTVETNLKVLITHFDEATFAHATLLLEKLRQNDIHSDIYPDQVKIKKQLNYANKINVPFVITIGAEEIETGRYSLKDMKTGETKKLSLAQLLGQLQD